MSSIAVPFQSPKPPSRRSWQPQKAWYSHVRIANSHVLLTLTNMVILASTTGGICPTNVRHERAGSCQSPDDLTSDPQRPESINQWGARSHAATPAIIQTWRASVTRTDQQVAPSLFSSSRACAQNRSEGTQHVAQCLQSAPGLAIEVRAVRAYHRRTVHA